MKLTLIVFSIFFLTNCSLNKNSEYWTNNKNLKSSDIKLDDNSNKNLSQILEKADDISSLTIQEYELFIKDYTKKSKFPDIKK